MWNKPISLILPAIGLITLALVLSSCQLSGLLDSTEQNIQLVQSNKPRNLNPNVSQADSHQLVSGTGQFAFDLYGALRHRSGNLFNSPLSISLALAMTYAGARGETEQQMATTLQFTLPQERLHLAFDALDLELASRAQTSSQSTGFQLKIANSTWGQTGYSFLSSYLDILAEDYGAGLRLLDFQKGPEEARITINNWVSQQTERKIRDLLPQGAITPDTRLVLTNAIYFKAAWLYPFNKDLTHDGTFQRLDGTQVDIPMMEQVQPLSYGIGQGYQAVELPYAGQALSMVILLPEASQFSALEGSLDLQKLTAILASMDTKNVHLTLPRFAFKSDFSLKDVLSSMGMADAFSGGADFSGMTGTKDLNISDVFHSAFVSVNEEGTEAAAATAVVIGRISLQSPQVDFKVDHPFIFLIRDKATGTILFLGRVMDPQA